MIYELCRLVIECKVSFFFFLFKDLNFCKCYLSEKSYGWR